MSFDLFAFDEKDPARPSAVLGFGGWDQLSWVFGDGGPNIYAVEPSTGNLLRYRDARGTSEVFPDVIGRGGWNSLTLLSSGIDGNLLAVDPSVGNLLRYSNAHLVGDGGLANPIVVGRGGWNAFSFVIYGGGGILYAAESNSGNLLRYSGVDVAGDGQVAAPSTIGVGGWADFVFLTAGGPGELVGVRRDGAMVTYRETDKVAELKRPAAVDRGPWLFREVFASGSRVFAIGRGPVSSNQILRTETFRFESTFVDSRIDKIANVRINTFDLNVSLPMRGIINTIALVERVGASAGAPLVVSLRGAGGTVLMEDRPTAVFRGIDGTVQSPVIHVNNDGADLDLNSIFDSQYDLFQGEVPLQGTVELSFWV